MIIDTPRTDIHLLLVDDNPRYLDELREWLKIFGYTQLDTVSSAAEAVVKLQHPCDVIIADMKMERPDSGFTVIEEVKQRNISSIVIILTANETILDCRRAFRMGAWDYISKNWSGNVFELLHQSIQDALIHYGSWGNLKDQMWLRQHIQQLLKDYPEKYVAICNNSVIAIADHQDELEQLIQERMLPRFLPLIVRIDHHLLKQLTKNLLVFVEGPTDVKYIENALKILGAEDLLQLIVLDTIGNRLGNQGGGWNNLKNAFELLKENRFTTNKILFLFDLDVKDKELPNQGQDFENLYIRRIGDFSTEKKGVESLLSSTLYNIKLITDGIGEPLQVRSWN